MSTYLSLQEVNPCMRAAGIDEQAAHIGANRMIYDHEIIYCHSGSFTVIYDHHSVTANAGDILIITPRIPHRLDYRHAIEVYWVHLDFFYHNDQDNLSRYLATDKTIALSPEGYTTSLARPGIIIKPSRHLPDLYPTENPKRTKAIFDNLTSIFENKTFRWSMTSKALLSELLSETFDHLWEPETSSHSNSQLVQSIIDYLNENAHRGVTGKELSNRFHYHQDTLNRFFKNELGVSLRSYQQQLKLDHVKQLLNDTDLTLDQIAEQANYSDRSHLIKRFTKLTGISPTAYRQRL